MTAFVYMTVCICQCSLPWNFTSNHCRGEGGREGSAERGRKEGRGVEREGGREEGRKRE